MKNRIYNLMFILLLLVLAQVGIDKAEGTHYFNKAEIVSNETNDIEIYKAASETEKTENTEKMEWKDIDRNVEELKWKEATQEDIVRIGGLHSLKKLEFYIYDENIDLSPLENLDGLEELSIISEEGKCLLLDTRPLGKLKNLRKVSLGRCYFDVSFLEKADQLMHLYVTKPATQEDIRQIGKLEHELSVYTTGKGYVHNGCRGEEYMVEYNDLERCLHMKVAAPLFSMEDSMDWKETDRMNGHGHRYRGTSCMRCLRVEAGPSWNLARRMPWREQQHPM